MKILAIRGENIASLKKFAVDFSKEPLKTAGIFAITGKTGAGKSSLLDSICLALYLEVPRFDNLKGLGEAKIDSNFGEIALDNIEQMIQRGAKTCNAEVDFVGIDGEKYRAKWGYDRTKNDTPKEVHILTKLDGQLVIATKKNEYKAKILELIGLTYDQFTRTVFLSQGKFAEFLRASENDKSTLLEKLTGTQIYSEISKRIFERHRILKNNLDLEKDKVKNIKTLTSEEVELKIADHERVIKQKDIIKIKIDASKDLLENLERANNVRTELVKIEKNLKDLEVEISSYSMKEVKLRESKKQREESKDKNKEVFEKVTKLDQDIHVKESELIILLKNLSEAKKNLTENENDLTAYSLKYNEGLKKKVEIDKWLEDNNSLRKVKENWSAIKQNIISYKNDLEKWKEHTKKKFEIEIKKKVNEEEYSKKNEKINILNLEIGNLTYEEFFKKRSEIQDLIKENDENKKFLVLSGDIEELKQKLKSIKELRNEMEISLPIFKIEKNSKEQSYNKALEVSNENVESLRNKLKEDEECPVCGSKNHPFAIHSPTSNKIIEELKYDLDRSREKFTKCELEIQNQLIEEDKISIQVSKKEKEIEALQVPINNFYLSVKDRLQDNRLEEVKKEEIRLNDELNKLNSISSKVDERKKIEGELPNLDNSKNGIDEQIVTQEKLAEKFKSDLSKSVDLLDQYLDIDEWKVDLEKNSEILLKKLEENVELYVKKEKEKTDIDKEVNIISEKLIDLKSKKNPLKNEFENKEIDYKKNREIVFGLKEERKNVFGDKNVSVERESLDKEITEAQRLIDEHLKLVSSKTNLRGIEQGKKTSKELLLKEHNEKIIKNSSLIDFVDKDFSGDDRSLVIYFDQIKNTINSSEEEFLRLTKTSAEIELQLKSNAENQKKFSEANENINKLESSFLNWSNLNSLIGSSSGDKFKKIAQGMTMKMLISSANAQLKLITDRYELIQIGESVHFAVKDNENFGETRPVQTLSGGETFIVSLALALGLSTMSSKGLMIETLFIDEGFGTLDQDILQSVMGALSQLHSQGRKVGLITHVEEMKEQIPTQILVEKIGGGISDIRVVG